MNKLLELAIAARDTPYCGTMNPETDNKKIHSIESNIFRDRVTPEAIISLYNQIDAKQASEWISVEDRLPEYGLTQVIAYSPRTALRTEPIITTRLFISGSFYATGFYSSSIRDVTHWMPLPEPPGLV